MLNRDSVLGQCLRPLPETGRCTGHGPVHIGNSPNGKARRTAALRGSGAPTAPGEHIEKQ